MGGDAGYAKIGKIGFDLLIHTHRQIIATSAFSGWVKSKGMPLEIFETFSFRNYGNLPRCRKNSFDFFSGRFSCHRRSSTWWLMIALAQQIYKHQNDRPKILVYILLYWPRVDKILQV